MSFDGNYQQWKSNCPSVIDVVFVSYRVNFRPIA